MKPVVIGQFVVIGQAVVNEVSFVTCDSALYKQPSLHSDASEFLDPNKLSPDGTISISTTAFSEDGRYFAYGLSEGGSDWITVHVNDLMNINVSQCSSLSYSLLQLITNNT